MLDGENINMSKVLIIGGGAAGMMAAIMAGRNGHEVHLYEKNEKLGRNSYNPYNLFSAIIFCFAFKKGTLRDIEEMCRYDVRLMYLMEQNTTSYKTISEFINEDVANCLYTGIMTDTGSFRYENTTEETFEIAAE